jgi:hemolysin activation/secretion protein
MQILRPHLAAVLIVCLPLGTAQAAETAAPNAGSILQEIQPVAPLSPSSGGAGLTIEPESGHALPPSPPFMVETIRISGNTLFDTETLHALVADAEGKSQTLASLGEVAGRITDYYRDHNYPLAEAIIPAQAIRDGVVAIEVIEARYGQIMLDNSSRVNDPLLQDTLAPLQGGQAIGQTELDHTLLLLSDIPGVTINATLKPGETAGTSELMVDTTTGPAVSGNVAVDDYGNRFTGRARGGGTANFIDPLQLGDVLSVSALTSGPGLEYGRIAYESLLNGEGTRMGGSYSALHYILGGPLASLDAHGTAQVESLWAKHPIVRSQDVNLYGQIQYDGLQLSDDVDVSSIKTDRHLNNGTMSLIGDARDAILSGGTTTWNLGLTAGRIDFDDAAAQSADASTAKTQGGFLKGTANLSYLQSLSPNNELYLNFSGQWANANLDPSEQMIEGGPYTVRAYDIGAVSGDIGYQGTAEFRHDLGVAWYGRWQASTFIDSAHVIVNKTVWAAGENSATLSGAGVGLSWAGPDQLSARTYIATPVGSVPSLVGSTVSIRAWAEISMGF